MCRQRSGRLATPTRSANAGRGVERLVCGCRIGGGLKQGSWCEASGTMVGDGGGCSGSFRRCSSSTPSSCLPQHCLSCHPRPCHCPYPPLSQVYQAPGFPPSRPLRPCPLSTSRTCPNSVHMPCRVPLLDDSSRPDPGVSATRSASRKRRSHSAGSDAVARTVRRISGRRARRRLRHGRRVSSGRAWGGL